MAEDEPKSHEFIAPLHGLRGIAALSVVMAHTWVWTTIPTQVQSALGVVLFFVLSGFLMGKLYLGTKLTGLRASRYVIARFARIYPLFAVAILAATVLLLLANRSPYGLKLAGSISHLLLFGSGRTVWTISVEFQFYAIFLIVWALASLLPRWRKVIVLVFLALALVIREVLRPVGTIDIFQYLHIFALGLVVASFASKPNGRSWDRIAGLIAAVMVFAYAIIYFWNAPLSIYGDWPVFLCVAILVASVVIAPASVVGRVLSSRPLVFLGEISFGIYLLHRFVQMALARLASGAPGPVLWLSELVLTCFAAWIAHLTIEVPARTAIRKWGERRLAGQPTTAAPAT